MHDDDSGGALLRKLADAPVPAARTTAGEVIAKGKRRLRLQRMAAVGSAVAVVAVIAAGTLILRPGGENGSVPLATHPSATSTSSALAGYTPVAAITPVIATNGPPTGPASTTTVPGPSSTDTATTTYETSVPPSGQVMLCMPGDGVPSSFAKLRPENEVEQLFVDGIVAATRSKPAAVKQEQWQPEPRVHMAFGLITAAVGGGMIELAAKTHGGTAREAADADAQGDPACAQLRRKTMPDGTVLQLSPRQQAQYLQIYAPSGRSYALTVTAEHGWPVSEEGLAVIGDSIARAG